MIRRIDFDAAKAALERAGFVYRRAASMDLFLDTPAPPLTMRSASFSRASS